MKDDIRILLELDFAFWCIIVLAVIAPSRSPIRTWEQFVVYAIFAAVFVVALNVVLLLYIKIKEVRNDGLRKKERSLQI